MKFLSPKYSYEDGFLSGLIVALGIVGFIVELFYLNLL
jgi:hypothetical protein